MECCDYKLSSYHCSHDHNHNDQHDDNIAPLPHHEQDLQHLQWVRGLDLGVAGGGCSDVAGIQSRQIIATLSLCLPSVMPLVQANTDKDNYLKGKVFRSEEHKS